MIEYDFAIIGAGIAGAGIAAHLSAHGRVVVLEAEDAPGYHTTGRSAALYSAAYGNATIRALTRASRPFFDAPPEGFASHDLLAPRGCLYIARADQAEDLAKVESGAVGSGVPCRRVTRAEALALCPILKTDVLDAAVFEPDAMDIDVNGLHQGFLRMAARQGAVLRARSQVTALIRDSDGWTIGLSDGTAVAARVLVNAAGAWAEAIGVLAGARPIGLMPLKRTAMILPWPTGVAVGAWPAVIDASEDFYFKPEAGTILASPADETPSPPLDAAPDELDIAICIDRIQQAAELPVQRVVRSWAGLRSFVADRGPVIGFDDAVEGFFWAAGQGGYGIQTAPAAARVAAALARGEDIPGDIEAFGVNAAALSPARLVRSVRVDA